MKDLYCDLKLPPIAEQACSAEAMQRLKHVNMNCGMNYTSFPLFVSMDSYTRYEHSVGTAKLIYSFTGDEVQTLAGLFHDIATPVFSHVVDFLQGDHMEQETTEAKTEGFIQRDHVIASLLEQYGIGSAAVSDYHQYPIADNDSPQLSCDRLEYTFGNMVNYGFAQELLVKEMRNDLVIAGNEHGIKELQFQTPDLALAFAQLALRCGTIYSSDENRFAMEYLARLLKRAIELQILTAEDLYGTEERIIQVLEQSLLQNEWQTFRRFCRIVPGTPEDGLNLNAKRRYIDPLIAGQGRVTDRYPSFREAVLQFKEESYDRWLKGVGQ